MKIKFLFVAAIVAFVLVSCTKESEILDMITPNGHADPSKSDTTTNSGTDTTTITPVDTTIVTIQNPTTISGNGEITSRIVNLSDFTEVELKKIGEVKIVKGNTYQVEVSDYKNLLSFSKVYLEGKKLVISYDDVQIIGSKLKVTITIPDKLSKAIVSGAGSLNIQSGYATDNFQLILSGSGSILANNINSNKVDITMPGAGLIEATGTTSNLTLGVKGSGTIKCGELTSNNAICDVSGVGTLFVNAMETLKVNAMGIGSLTYYGAPALEVNKGNLFTVTKG
jgi:hypothetical protein